MKYFIFITLLFSTLNSYSQFEINFDESVDPLNLYIGDQPNDSLWQIGPPQKTILNSAYSFPNAIITDTVNTYPTNQSAEFFYFMDAVSSYGFPAIQIDWEQMTDLEAGVDGIIIEASYDEMNSWNNVLTDSSFRPLVVGQYIQDTLFNGQVGITGSTDWVYVGLCWGTYFSDDGTAEEIIDNFNDNNYSIIVRFTFVSDSTDTKHEGYMMDNFNFRPGFIGAVNENENNIQLKMFPNPASEYINIEFEEVISQDAFVEIFSMEGKKVFSKQFSIMNNTTLKVPLFKITKGQYLLHIKTKDNQWGRKFVKE